MSILSKNLTVVCLLIIGFLTNAQAADLCQIWYTTSPGSILSKNPQVSDSFYKWHTEIQAQKASIVKMMKGGEARLTSVVDALIDFSKDMSEDLRKTSTLYPFDSPISVVLRSSSARTYVGAKGEYNLIGMRGQYGHMQIKDLNGEERGRIYGYLHNLEAEFAELTVAFSVEGLQSKSTQVKNLPEIQLPLTQKRSSDPNLVAEYFESAFRGSHKNMEKTDLDIVFKDGRAWGEVKNFNSVFFEGQLLVG